MTGATDGIGFLPEEATSSAICLSWYPCAILFASSMPLAEDVTSQIGLVDVPTFFITTGKSPLFTILHL